MREETIAQEPNGELDPLKKGQLTKSCGCREGTHGQGSKKEAPTPFHFPLRSPIRLPLTNPVGDSRGSWVISFIDVNISGSGAGARRAENNRGPCKITSTELPQKVFVSTWNSQRGLRGKETVFASQGCYNKAPSACSKTREIYSLPHQEVKSLKLR